MSDVRACDMCRATIRSDDVSYHVDRFDMYGPLADMDACSPECLAVLAIGDAHLRGEHNQRTAHKCPTPTPKRWWQR